MYHKLVVETNEVIAVVEKLKRSLDFFSQIAGNVYSQCSSFKQFPGQLRRLMHLSLIYDESPPILFGSLLPFKNNILSFHVII